MDKQTKIAVYVLISLFLVTFALSTTSVIQANLDPRFDKFVSGCSQNVLSADSDHGSIVGGCNNKVISDSDFSIIGGGNTNTISGTSSAGIIGGKGNNITQSDHAAVIGGLANSVTNNSSGDSNESIVLGGQANNIKGAASAAIVGGINHNINGGSDFCAILGGQGLSTFSSTKFFQTGITGQYNDAGTSELAASASGVTGTQFNFLVGAGGTESTRLNGFSVDNKGNLYFGTEVGCSIYERNSNGSFSAKAFTIQHPSEEERWLVHGCLEGPEAGVYYRGRDVAPTFVKLPDYATKIAQDFTVQITPVGGARCMGCGEIDDEGKFEVYGEGKFQWHATGRRLSFDVEPMKKDVVIKRMGPYTWQE